MRTVGELACQSIQDIRDACFVVHRDTSVVRDEGNLRAFCCTLDDGVARFVVLSRFAISFMRIVDIRIATVVVDGQAVRILLEDVARFRFAFAANEFCQVASVVRFRTPGTLFDCAPFFVVPGCAVLQEDIDCTIEGLAAGGFTCIAKLVVCHAGPYGICRCQTQVDVGVRFRFVGVHCTSRCCDVAFQYQFVVSGAGCLVVVVQVDVQTGGAAFCQKCIVVMFVILIDFDVAAAVDGQFRMTAIRKEAVAVDLRIDITVDGDLRSHLQAVVAAAVYQRAAIVTPSALACT